MSDKVTCGVLFQKAMTQIIQKVGNDPVLLFCSGHVCGQAEKIYLGACSAAMFRPSTEEHRNNLLISVIICSAVYELEVSVFEREEIQDEIWLHTPKAGPILADCLNNDPVNSVSWHYLRGLMCGIPQESIDHEFHLRKGYRQPCDQLVEEMGEV